MLNKDKLSTVIGRRSRREAFTVAVAAVGLVAVAASSAVSFADDSVPERAAMVVEQAENIPAVGAAPAVEAIPAPAPAPEVAPAPAPEPAPAPMPEPAPAPPAYPDNLDGWIRQALDIMAAKGIPGSYEGIHRNIMRESTGNPQAINLWDSNAAMGIPSKGLLQVIDPTFAAYHVEGTPFDVWNPVSNIVAACNYAAHRYGSMDNVNSAY
ncbi:transglycosylase SLT domain-containing protein [Nocardia asteroides]|uniref:transglycosylase SLT domain-containing protein n=1 Tax=Nocardia asteroides TaxID=1824 RepID=UPI001E2C761F|nr:transglycosylase SLT domain-containing protein [Nocardia asteroides]UGT53953.1 transglycosylase SLT domain-containing protein [Nocardia asteroides]